MASKTNNNLRIGFGVSIFLLVVSSIISFICIQNLLKSATWVRQSNEIKLTLKSILASLKDAEIGQHAYLLTDRKEFLTPYYGAKESTINGLNKALDLTSENDAQYRNIEQLSALANKRMSQIEEVIARKSQGQSVTYDDMAVGKISMDSVRGLVDKVIKEEDNILRVRTKTMDRLAMLTPAVIIFAALLAVIISLIFYLRLIKDIAERTKLQEELLQKDKDITHRISMIQDIAEKISSGDYSIRINDKQKDSLGSVALSLDKMAESLSSSFTKLTDNEWLQSGVAKLNEKMVGEKDLPALTYQVIEFIAVYSGSHVGAIYLRDKDQLVLNSGYALRENTQKKIPVGQGIVGQALLSQSEILLEEVDPDYVTVSHATGQVKARSVIAFPIFNENEAIGVLELAAIKPFTQRDISFFKTIGPNIGTAIQSAINHRKLQELLEETQAQSEELQAQHSELENINAELEAHAQRLQTSEEELRVQQEELRQSNAELEERNQIINERNLEIQKKAEELEQSTKYKSEFMANMSHELRTPLNSILLLSRYLSDNSELNMNEDQKESARVIYNSGNGLLELIDELLDLSKIEAGKMEVDYSHVAVSEILSDIHGVFQPIAKEKNITLRIENHLKDHPTLYTDQMKLEQILKNLLSNALKFTSEGYVALTLSPSPYNPSLIQFAVEDTGIGIANDKLEMVFDAFMQADGSTRRKYGGTGLGLSISRELARLLGGEITVTSDPGKGSIFTLLLPASPAEENMSAITRPAVKENLVPEIKGKKSRFLSPVIPDEIEDDRGQLKPGDKTILIIEDDTVFAKALLQFARKQQYKGIVAVRGDQGIQMAMTYKPTAILLDIQLPIMDGWEVMDELKSNSETRHIPVHIMSSYEVKKESKLHGAVDFINKPVAMDHMKQMFRKLEEALTKSPKRVLIIEENTKHAEALSLFLQTNQVAATVKHSVSESAHTLQHEEIDCVILDMGIPGKNAYDTLEIIKTTPGIEDIPIIIFTGKSLSQTEEQRIKQYADSIVVKTAHSYQRILDEVALFLHLIEEDKQKTTKPRTGFRNQNEVLKGKTVLIADDDVRNIFSLTKSLEKHHVNVITATDGVDALMQLHQHPQIDIVLMDMMMPQMDGYESTMKIRQNPDFKNIPVIAVTAKAMLGDREKCIAAGASDYISKPVDIDQLLSLLRVWLYDK